VPYVADLLALRRVPAQLFAITMSLNPLFAATAGVVVLDEAIEVHEWVGIIVIVLANVVTSRSASRRSPRIPHRRPRSRPSTRPGQQVQPVTASRHGD
jgi:inner membrane transporter RhtA